VIPALYIQGYALSGKYNYGYDGENLEIWKNMGNNEILYNLKLLKTN